MKKLSLVFLIFLSCIVVVENGEVKKKSPARRKKEVSLSAKKITLSSPSADLRIYGWEKDSIDLKYEILKGEADVKIKKKDNETEIKVMKEEDEDLEIEITLLVPYGTELKVETGVGKVILENLKGELNIQLGAGSIETKEVEGKLKIELGTGKVTSLFEEAIPDEFNVNLGVGEVETILNSDAEVEFNAKCGIGKVESEFEFDEIHEKNFFIGGSFEGVRGKGKKEFDIEVGIGKVSLYPSE